MDRPGCCESDISLQPSSSPLPTPPPGGQPLSTPAPQKQPGGSVLQLAKISPLWRLAGHYLHTAGGGSPPQMLSDWKHEGRSLWKVWCSWRWAWEELTAFSWGCKKPQHRMLAESLLFTLEGKQCCFIRAGCWAQTACPCLIFTLKHLHLLLL